MLRITTAVRGLRGQDPARGLDAVHVGHGDIHHHHVGRLLLSQADAVAAVGGLGHHRSCRAAFPAARAGRRAPPCDRQPAECEWASCPFFRGQFGHAAVRRPSGCRVPVANRSGVARPAGARAPPCRAGPARGRSAYRSPRRRRAR